MTAQQCPSCGAGNTGDARFCSSCGTPLARTCRTCGAPAHGRFCSQCGVALDGAAGTAAPPAAPVAPVAPVAERRLTTILFADLVGFTPLSERRDAEEVRELLSRYFDVARTLVARYGGTIEKFIGDAVMAVWGVPVAHEDGAERAVRAGLDLVDAVAALGEEVRLPDLALRVGVVTGEVAVTLGAVGEGMVAGDPVNTASRVQAAAAAGEVWVDEPTRALTSAAVVYADAGRHTLKGKTEPIALFAAREVAASVGGAQRIDGLEARFVGRERELRLVKELFHATIEERRPRLVSVCGQAGVGKTRLGWEFYKYVDGIASVVRWHRGRCSSYGEPVPFRALADVVRSRLQIFEGEDASSVLDKLDAGLARWAADRDEHGWLRPRLATLLGIAEAAGVTSPLMREDLFASWQLFLERLVDSDDAAEVLLIEDAHAADDGLLDFLDLLVERSAAPIFVLALGRPEITERRPSWATGRRCTAIYLEPLAPVAMATLVDELVDGLSDGARRTLVDRTEGIPLYAVETVRALIDRDAVVPRDGRYVLADDEMLKRTATAPKSLHNLIAARLDALSPAERMAVQNAAVLGQTFTRDALVALTTPSGAADLEAVLTALVRKDILAVESDPRSPERGRYRFVQALVRTVAHETLSRRDRKVRHLRAAEHLQAEPDADALAAVLAQHYLDAQAAAPDDADAASLTAAAVDLLERAAQRAAELGASAQAMAHYRAALECTSDDDVVGRLATGAALTAVNSGDVVTAQELARQGRAAYERAGSVLGAAEALYAYSRARNSAGYGAELIEPLTAMHDALEGLPGAAAVQMRLASELSRAHFSGAGSQEGALPWLHRASSMAEAEEDWEQLAISLSHEGALLATAGRRHAALALLQASLDVARAHALPPLEVPPLNNLACFLAAWDLRNARRYAEEGLALARRLGVWDAGSFLHATACSIYWLDGNWAALEELQRIAAPTRHHTAAGATYVSLARLARGQQIQDPPAKDESGSGPQTRAALLCYRTVAHLEAGNRAAAFEAALEALDTYVPFGGFDDDFHLYWCTLLDLALEQHRLDVAETWLRRVAEVPRGQVSPLLRALLPYFRARLRATGGGGAAAEIQADYAAAATALEAFGAPYWHARCLLDQATWLADLGRGAEAQPVAERAEQIFRSLDASPWAERASSVPTPALRG